MQEESLIGKVKQIRRGPVNQSHKKGLNNLKYVLSDRWNWIRCSLSFRNSSLLVGTIAVLVKAEAVL